MSDYPGDTEQDHVVTRLQERQNAEQEQKHEQEKRSSIASQTSEHTVSPDAGESAPSSVSPGGQISDNIQPETTPKIQRGKSAENLQLFAQLPSTPDAQSSSQSRSASEIRNLPSNPQSPTPSVVNLSIVTPPIVIRTPTPPPAPIPPTSSTTYSRSKTTQNNDYQPTDPIVRIRNAHRQIYRYGLYNTTKDIPKFNR